jgi:hypothetical protein
MGTRNGNGNGNHSREQGLRLHHLANLGGLVALAGLDLEPPDYLLGALVSVAEETQRLTPEQRERVAAVGRRMLDERATGKRAWKSWTRARELHPITLSNAQVAEIIAALGGEVPQDPTRLPLALSQVLSEASNGTA